MCSECSGAVRGWRVGRRRRLDVLSGVKYQESQGPAQLRSHLLLEASHHDSDHLVCLGSLSLPSLPLPLRFTAAEVPEGLHRVLMSPKESHPAPLFSQ